MLDLARFDQMIVLHPNSRDISNFMTAVTRAGNGMGWQMPRFILQNINKSEVRNYIDAINQINVPQGHMACVICILPNKGPERYNGIKKRCSVDRGIPSQVNFFLSAL